jgi:acyl transferase domain-containing protein
VKANIGHLEGASGIAGLIKAVMVLKRDQVPPQLGFISEKPGLNLEARNIKVSDPPTNEA